MNVRTLNKFLEIYNYELFLEIYNYEFCTKEMTQEGKMKLDT